MRALSAVLVLAMLWAYFLAASSDTRACQCTGHLLATQSSLRRQSGRAQGQHVTYAYKTAGQLTGLTRGAGTANAVTETFGYSGTQLVTVTTPLGHVGTLSYDPFGRPTSIASPAPAQGPAGPTPAYSTTITHGPTQTVVVEGAATAAALTTTRGYAPDSAVLTQAAQTGGTRPLGPRTTARYNALDWLSSLGDGSRPTAITRYGYDAAGRLRHITTVNGSSQTRVSLGYNARGLRSSYVVTMTGQSQPTLSESLLYRGTLVGQVVVSGTNVSPAYTETFLYRQDGTPLELLRQVAGQAGTSRYDYLVDGRGTVVGLTDSNGVVQNSYTYTGLWGQPDLGSTEAVPQPLHFAGYWYDGWAASAQAGDRLPWYWLQTRSYDPVLKRFLQPDPSSQDGVRSYVYAHDDPVDLADPSGLESGCGSTNSEGGGSSQACGSAARAVRGGGGGGGGSVGEVAPLNEPVQMALPGLEPVADPAGPQYSRVMFSLRLSQGWQRRLRALVNPADQIVYQLSDVASQTGETTMILKVGRTTGQRSIGRFEPYATAGGRLGLTIEVTAWAVDVPENTSLGHVENTFRQTLLSAGEVLPWDNAILPGTTTPRLERPGSGVPFVYLAKPAELGYKWDSNPASQYFGFYLDGNGMPVPQYPDYYPRPLGLLPGGR